MVIISKKKVHGKLAGCVSLKKNSCVGYDLEGRTELETESDEEHEQK